MIVPPSEHTGAILQVREGGKTSAIKVVVKHILACYFF